MGCEDLYFNPNFAFGRGQGKGARDKGCSLQRVSHDFTIFITRKFFRIENSGSTDFVFL